ncbi:hypothetical protein CDES_13845 [Corynebacterium deserti GIMN1.010]|uniref:Uncharacterized protein n=1 Tax=Corynebacterium deserti GIMN1.010 TaxID=931089 RepID=A0A0M5IM56_9CORY|nr:hypothetical protein CDES_13845 [Corynebacterium deserti GIMN1.010]
MVGTVQALTSQYQLRAVALSESERRTDHYGLGGFFLIVGEDVVSVIDVAGHYVGLIGASLARGDQVDAFTLGGIEDGLVAPMVTVLSDSVNSTSKG